MKKAGYLETDDTQTVDYNNDTNLNDLDVQAVDYNNDVNEDDSNTVGYNSYADQAKPKIISAQQAAKRIVKKLKKERAFY